MPPASHWRRKRPSAKTRDSVLWALRGGVAMSVSDLAVETGIGRQRVCAALDDLRIRGAVEVDDAGKYRRTDAEAKTA